MQYDIGAPTNRDQYLFDIVCEAGLDITDPADWVNISKLLYEVEPCEVA